mgnify:CR=1 FL=1
MALRASVPDFIDGPGGSIDSPPDSFKELPPNIPSVGATAPIPGFGNSLFQRQEELPPALRALFGRQLALQRQQSPQVFQAGNPGVGGLFGPQQIAALNQLRQRQMMIGPGQGGLF